MCAFILASIDIQSGILYEIYDNKTFSILVILLNWVNVIIEFWAFRMIGAA